MTEPVCQPMDIKCPGCGATAQAKALIGGAGRAETAAVRELVREIALSNHQCKEKPGHGRGRESGGGGGAGRGAHAKRARRASSTSLGS